MQARFKIDLKATILLLILLFSLGVKALHTHEHKTLWHAKHIEDTCAICQFTIVHSEEPRTLQIEPPTFEAASTEAPRLFIAPYIFPIFHAHLRRGPPQA